MRSLSCYDCIEVNKIKERLPICSECQPFPFEKAISENDSFFELIDKYSFIMTDSMSGGVSAIAVKLILDLEKIDKDIFLEKCNIYYNNGLRVRSQED